MKHNILKTIAAAAVMAATTTATAQVALRSGYHVEGYSYRHQLNPALAPDRGYVSIPLLSGLNVTAQSNVGIGNFIYETKGNPLYTGSKPLMLFTNKAVDGASFLGELKDRNRIHCELNMTIFSFGMHKWGGFNTFDINMRSSSAFCLPKGLFEFVKDLSSDHSYSFDDLGISSTEYVEIALGHSRRINDEWRAGAKVKILLGIADADARVENMTANLSGDKWTLTGNGYADISLAGLKTKLKDNSQIDDLDFDDNAVGLAGMGFAVDLGATYRPHFAEGLELSAAINDLGFMKWSKNLRGNMQGEWECDGLHISQDDEDKGQYNSFDTELDNLGDDLEDAFKLYEDPAKTSRSRMLGATLNIGASYKLPMYDRLKFGFLSSTRINGPYTWSEGRFSANVAPLKWIDVTVNYAASSFGNSMGWLLNLHTRGIAFFIGSDHIMFKRTPQGLPSGNCNTNVHLGINFPIGKQMASSKL